MSGSNVAKKLADHHTEDTVTVKEEVKVIHDGKVTPPKSTAMEVVKDVAKEAGKAALAAAAVAPHHGADAHAPVAAPDTHAPKPAGGHHETTPATPTHGDTHAAATAVVAGHHHGAANDNVKKLEEPKGPFGKLWARMKGWWKTFKDLLKD